MTLNCGKGISKKWKVNCHFMFHIMLCQVCLEHILNVGISVLYMCTESFVLRVNLCVKLSDNYPLS